MQMVIEIPENEYRYIKEIYEKNDIVEGIYSYIYHGIPLPEHHGDLIDRNEINIPYDICDGEEAMEFVHDTPTIIEADKEGSEK